MYKIDLPTGVRVGFLAHPRTASPTIREAILEAGGTRDKDHHWPLEPMSHGKHKEYERVEKEYDILLCTVRNPYDVICSWNAMIGWSMTGNSVNVVNRNIERGYFRSEGNGKVSMFPFLDICTHFMRFEDLKEDWDWFCEIIGIEPKELDHLTRRQPRNKPPNHWREILDDSDRQVIETCFADELRDLGYGW